MANLKEQEKWEDGVYQIEENDPVLGGENGITNKPIKQLANRTLWLKKTLELFGKKSTPKDLVADSTSTVDGFGHSHKLPLASISDKGIVKLNSQTASDSEQDAATPKAVKIAYDKAVEAKTAADNAQRKANEGVSKANEANNNAEGRVSKSGDRLTGILYSVGISSKHFGYGAYANQYTIGAPFMVETTGSQDRDTYHPFVKGLVRSKGRYGAAFSLGYTTKQGQGDGFGRGIIHLIEDNGSNKTWAFEHNGDFNSAGDVRTSNGKSLNTAAQLSDFQYQKIGDFEIRRYPDGMMIQTYFTEFNDIHASSLGFGGTGQKQLTWAVSFVGKPMVFGNITTSLNDHHDVGVNILTKSTNTTLYWYNYEHSNPNQGLCRLQFLAVGRWK